MIVTESSGNWAGLKREFKTWLVPDFTKTSLRICPSLCLSSPFFAVFYPDNHVSSGRKRQQNSNLVFYLLRNHLFPKCQQWMCWTLLDGHYPIANLEWLSTFRDMDLHTNIWNLELGNEGEGNNLSFWSIPHPSQLPWDHPVRTMTFPSFHCFLEETWGIVTRRTSRGREWRGI